MERKLYDEDHEGFRELVREFVRREVSPNIARWEHSGELDAPFIRAAAEAGIIGLAAPTEFGGGGQLRDYRFRNVVIEELALAGAGSVAASLSIQDDIVIPYVMNLADRSQQERWLPGLADGSIVGAIAMTEPGAGSDLRGVRTRAEKVDGGYVLNGAKTFITCGHRADLVIVVAKTGGGNDPRSISLLGVEAGTPGFEKGAPLDKLGLKGSDTAELSFTDVFVPEENLIGGEEGQGFYQLMHHLPLERLSIAAAAVAAADAAAKWALEYTGQREAFGQPILDFQNTRFELADITTEVTVGQAYLDGLILAWNDGTLTAVEAARAKLWASEMQARVVDRSLQLFGGYGYMREYPITRAYAEARVTRIYGGTNEIMREIIGRELAGRK